MKLFKKRLTKQQCPCCQSLLTEELLQVSQFNYFQCNNCSTLFIDPKVIEQIDQGMGLIEYTESYWQNEVHSALERAYSVALARMAELLHYSRIPVTHFLDLGTGPGYFLDAVTAYLPEHHHVFYGVEKFPPPAIHRTQSKNYFIGDLRELPFRVDAGLCMEVIEHLTPRMLAKLLDDLAAISTEQAIYIFNSGQPSYVLHEDMNYLDPIVRGHILSYSLDAVKRIAQPHGFTLFPLVGKTWAFVLEYHSCQTASTPKQFQQRIWNALPENLALLQDSRMGSALRLLGLETARAYG